MDVDRSTGSANRRAESFGRNAWSVFVRISFQEDGWRRDGDITALTCAGSRGGQQATVAQLKTLRQRNVNAATVLRALRFGFEGSPQPIHDELAAANYDLSATFT